MAAVVTVHWYRVVVGDPLLEPDPFAAVLLRCQRRYSGRSDARLVTRLESDGGVQCGAVAYLSPEAADLARELEAQPVPRPDWVESTGL